MASKRAATTRSRASSRKRVAAYTRISKDPLGQSDAPERQLKDIRAHAKIHDLDIVEVFEDRDRSAYRPNVVREQFEEMVLRLDAGEFEAILCWKLDRLVRRTVEFARVWEICQRHGANLISVRDSLDTSTDVGVMVASILVAFAQMESATTSTRSRAKERSIAEAGGHKGRSRRAFGYEPGWSVIVEDEAALIREAAERLLAGERPYGIVVDWNKRGHTTLHGKTWSPFALTTLMRQARLFGWREHHGELVAAGDWPPILDEEVGRAVRRLLERKSPPGEQTRRRYLLTGILVCGKCGHGMKATGKASTGPGGRRGVYTCPPKIEGGCNGITVLQAPVTEAVEEMMLNRLDSPQLRKTIRTRRRRAKGDNDAELLRQIGVLDRRVTELVEAFRAAEMSATAYGAATRALEEESDELAARLATLHQAEPFEQLLADQGGVRSMWAQLDDERKRTIISALVDRIIVHPVGRGQGRYFRPERLEPIWRA